MSPTTRRHRLRARYEHHRARLDAYPRLRLGYKVLVGLVGVLVVALGLVLVPLPGPGWLVVFVGVAVLGTEFPAAHRVTEFVRRQLRRARTWWRARRVARSAAREAAASGAPRPAPRTSTGRAPSH